ncbi:MAG: ATP-binding protein [bacterium]|nr:ATP-binding protein [bacterium]
MTTLSLRWRIIVALIALTLGTTLALFFLARYFLDLSLQAQTSITEKTGDALNDALALAKENYARRKVMLQEAGRKLRATPLLREAAETGTPESIRISLQALGIQPGELRFLGPQEIPEKATEAPLSTEPIVFKDPNLDNALQLLIPLDTGGPYAALLVTEPLDELLSVEEAAHTYRHLQMIESDLRRGFLLFFLVATISLVLLACLVGIRIGFGVTHPLCALLKGTRELARDNLDYRIPPGRDDEIGLLIHSFNRMAEDLKQNRRQRLEAEKIAAWREIARRLAHEIKNPLTPIQLTVQQMRDKYTGTDPAYRQLVADCTEIVTEEVENLRSLVQEFADFARMPSLSLGVHDLNAVVTDAARLYSDASLQLDLTTGLPLLNLDSEQMHRVLINLIENGLEATQESGPIRVVTRQEGGTILLRVEDGGPGVPEADRERIFQPYISSKPSGMGLGLAMVRSIVENHGGRIVVTSSPEGGARFEITLPVPETCLERPEVRT